jgi:hypothetical protein
LCPDCLVDLGKGMACKGRCEGDVRDLIAVTEVNVAVISKMPRQLRVNRLGSSLMGWFLASMGALFVLLSALSNPASGGGFLFGGLLLFFGLAYLLVVSRMPRYGSQEGNRQAKEEETTR